MNSINKAITERIHIRFDIIHTTLFMHFKYKPITSKRTFVFIIKTAKQQTKNLFIIIK